MRPLAVLFFAVLSAVASDDFAGRWEGDVTGTGIRLVIDLAPQGEGAWTGSAILPGFGVKGAPLSAIAIKDGMVDFTIKALGNPSLEGHLDPQGALAGEFQLAGNRAPFVLRKTGPPQVEPQPQSTAVGKDFEGEWQGEMQLTDYPVHVTLTLENHAGGPATAHFLVVGKRRTDVPVSRITQEDAWLTVESQELGITCEGQIHEGAGEIAANFREGPFDVPLLLRRR